MDYYELAIQLSGLLLAIIAGFKGIYPLVNTIKNSMNLSGRWAQLVLIVVVVVASMATSLVQGALTPDLVNMSTIVNIFLAMLTTSQAEFQRQKNMEGV